jgi:hypothetical protein
MRSQEASACKRRTERIPDSGRNISQHKLPVTNPHSGGEFAQHSLVYIIGSVISVVGGMLMVPVYTRALSPSDYGVLDTILRFVTMCIGVAHFRDTPSLSTTVFR